MECWVSLADPTTFGFTTLKGFGRIRAYSGLRIGLLIQGFGFAGQGSGLMTTGYYSYESRNTPEAGEDRI